MKKIYIFLFFLLLSSIFTHPLIFNLKTILLGWPLDVYNYLWNIDTFWTAILNGNNPFFTNRIFYPLGTGLVLHTYAPVVSLLGIFSLNNLPLFFNILTVLSLPVAGICSYLLIFEITKNWKASLFGGIVYGFSPIMVSFLVSQHFYFAFAAPLLPLSILFLKRFLEVGTSKNLLILVLLFWITLGIDYYTTVMFVITNLIYFISHFLTDARDLFKLLLNQKITIIKIITIFLILPSIFLYKVVSKENTSLSFRNQSNYYPNICSAEIKDYFVPSQFNPFLKNLSEKISQKYTLNKDFDTPSLYVGIIAAICSLLAFLFYPIKKVFPYALICVVFFLIPLGPKTYFYNLLLKVPLMGLIDCPQRFVTGLELPLAVLSSLFVFYFLKKRGGRLIYFIVLLLTLFEFMTFNLPYSKIEMPKIYRDLALEAAKRTVLELPSGIAESKGAFGYDWSIPGLLTKQMYWQTVSDKQRVGGYISRLPKSHYQYFQEEPVISDLFTMTSKEGEWTNKKFTDQEIDAFISNFNLGYIILSPNPRQNDFAKVIETVFYKKISEKKSEEGFLFYRIIRD